MRIYVKTEPYKENSYMQHLIEHIVAKPDKTSKMFFDYSFPLKASSYLNYTTFYFNNRDPKEVLDQIFLPFSFKRIVEEKKLIKDECWWYKNDRTLLVNRLGKELYGENFWRAKASFQCKNIEVIEQYQKFYSWDNIWICDNDFKVLQRPKHIKAYTAISCDFFSSTKLYKIRNTSYVVKIFEDSVCAYILCYFLDRFVYVWAEYYYNHCARSYDYPTLEFFEYRSHLVLILWEDLKDFLNIPIDRQFFDDARAFFIWNLEYLQEIALVWEIRYGKIVELENIQNYILNLSLMQVEDYLK